MNIITSFLTISLLIVIPSCGGKNNCKATYIDENNNLKTEQLASLSEEETVTNQNIIKC